MAFMPWQQVFLVFAALIMTVLLFLPMLRSTRPASRAELEESMGSVLRRAFTDPSYLMIFAGFFSCGYQLGFITAHFPAMITEMCGPIAPDGGLAALGITTTSALGAVAISLIGTAVSAGTLARTSAMPGSALMRLTQWPRRDAAILPLRIASSTLVSTCCLAAAAVSRRPSAASAPARIPASRA